MRRTADASARRTLGSALAIVMLLAGCASTPNSGSTPTPSLVAPTAAPTSAAATRAGGAVEAVDLVFSGSANITAKGSAGQCRIGKSSTGATLFGFSATEADYPGLGSVGFNLDENPGGPISTKFAVNNTLAWFGYQSSGVAFSADHHTATLDFDFPPHPGYPEHVKGTIFCP